MGVTQTNTLQPIEQANNDIPINLSADNFISTPGQTAWIDILVNTKDNAASLSFQLSWNNINLVFTSKVSPKDTGLDFPYGTAYSTIALWLAAIAIYLNKNELLHQNFNIWSSGSHLYLESYVKSSTYTISFTTTDFDWVVAASNAGVDEVLELNYTIVLSVFTYNGTGINYQANPFDLYQLVKTYEVAPLNNGTALLFIQEALKPYFTELIPPIFNVLLGLYKEPREVLKYYYRYAAKYGSPPIQQETIQSSILLAINSGFSRKDFANTNLMTVISGASAKFLSWHPLTKELTKEQHDYLYFIQTFPTESFLFARYVATKTDGSQQTYDNGTFFGNNQYDVHLIPVHYAFLYSLFGVDLVSYTVQMIGADTGALSEIRTFNIYSQTPLNAKYFLFKNSFGVYESICFTGERLRGVQIKKLTSKKIINFGDDETVNENITSSSKFNRRSKIYTGFKTQIELDYFIEFLKSKAIYEQMPTYYKPVFVNREKINLYKDQEFINSADVEIIDNTEDNYSNA